ncbi:hypothetical protein Y032_1021g3419 [Ancylostoma ceylanicum]|uniref:Uncharacterized protein n=1 Tax=Ancylostoma ceylanicum TaxID=53326 RepID=A0A016W7K7_9BILA|nr:hypothetical protein Y032_1021g3419 [Ancylostoma ceylanicum]
MMAASLVSHVHVSVNSLVQKAYFPKKKRLVNVHGLFHPFIEKTFTSWPRLIRVPTLELTATEQTRQNSFAQGHVLLQDSQETYVPDVVGKITSTRCAKNFRAYFELTHMQNIEDCLTPHHI